MKIFEEKLVEYNLKNGIILDGYPRTEKQASHLDQMLNKIKLKIDVVVNIDVSEQLIIDRIINRRICSACGEIYNLKYGKRPQNYEVCDKCGSKLIQRSDDNEKTVRGRLETYNNTTKDLLKYYEQKGVLFNLHSDQNTTVDEAVEHAMTYISDIN